MKEGDRVRVRVRNREGGERGKDREGWKEIRIYI